MDRLTRFCSELVADAAEQVGVPTLVFFTLLAAILAALGWYFWPGWLPWKWRWRDWGSRIRRRFRLPRLRWRLPRWRLPRWRLPRARLPRWRLLRWRRRRKPPKVATPPAELPEEEALDILPDLPAEELVHTADQLAQEGRYAEAVRERLRAIVRDLIERGVLLASPGWTVTELVRAAAARRPALAAPLADAAAIFSEIWYGLRAATPADDAAMRERASAVTAVLAEPATAVTEPAAVATKVGAGWM